MVLKQLKQMFSWNPSEEDMKALNDEIAFDTAYEISNIVERSGVDYYDKWSSIINETLNESNDQELAQSIKEILTKTYSS